ncbi:MAG: ThiF family adenylyltransferase [Candidatus Hydrogenedentes bacterium]|nr:ThiF family adenylyltransferase [Candidatus Hydrogenedentota bacterium]
MSTDLTRYHRQMLVPGFGATGQRKLLGSTVLVMGCGALGSVAADLLARAGVGHLKIVDRDFIELTNLQRQVLFDEQDVAQAIPKAEAAKRKIARHNSQVNVTAIVDDLNHGNFERYAKDADVLLDGLDNFETRYLANDYAVKHGVPYVYGGAVSTVGMAYAILPHTPQADAWWEKAPEGNHATPCLRCLFEELPPPGECLTCDTAGILAPAASIIASFQVAETLKLLTGTLAQVCPTMLNIDLWANSFMQLKVGRAREHGHCPCCKHHRFDYLEGKAGSIATSLCGGNAVQLRHRQSPEGVDLREIAGRLAQHGKVVASDFMVRLQFVLDGREYEISLFADGRAIVKGTAETALARSLYAKYIGN